MKKITFLLGFLFVGIFANAKDVIWVEDFETDGDAGVRYQSSNSFNDGDNDLFARWDDAYYTSPNNSYYWAGEDLDDDGGDGKGFKTITFNSVDIDNYSNLSFSALIASGNGGEGWDSSDKFYFEYSIDGGDFIKVLQFVSPTSGSNTGMKHDTNLDGTGDGDSITNTFVKYSASINTQGSSIVFRVYASANSGGEQFAFDNLMLTGDAAGGLLKPTIANLSPATESFHELGASFNISGTVSTTEGTIDSVKVAYGQSADALNDSLLCEVPADGVYSVSDKFTEVDTVFYQMVAFGSNGTVKTSSVLELYGVCPTVDVPEAIAASDINVTSFTANWNAINDADGYKLNVWTVTAATVVSNDIFFSEYGDGASGDEKYFEIYNGTADTVFLDAYAHPNVTNEPDIVGEYESWNTFKPGAFIAPGDVYVVAHTSASEALKAKANELDGSLSNGDDGRALVKNDGVWNDADNDEKVDAGEMTGFTVLDWLGDFQGDPGYGWELAGVAKATVDHVLVRKSSVSDGNNDWNAARGADEVDSEWMVKDEGDHIDLGQHTMDGSAFKTYVKEGEDLGDVTSKSLTGLTTNTKYYYSVVAYNEYACVSDVSNCIEVTPSNATSLEATAADLKVYSAARSIVICTAEQAELSIYEITGRLVANKTILGDVQFAVKSGIYLVKVNDTIAKVAVK